MKRTGMLESVVLGIVLLGGIVANADVRLAKIFTDNMMLQRDKPIRIWGWAAPGENVKVMLAGKAASSCPVRSSAR